ncbi:NAD-dependent epimerase/dehydratase family protein [Agromyces cerinus]|uniref:Nucleoside-diphosphate-sugar epimerase n=1 Tax=Agromyces cerinus subsp. cerinus TaxID=232089 RepID=A0A1N6DIP6_9MICO|nr:NAD-dependent epimerase/dehydratase family protein [Agromyces cerinus]SIN70554.1 Nucleoside-diphosphate-sugar epimerase [Agromyces cerinus subsp. cerinus]
MRTALIGYTGFVGSNLASRHEFDAVYNTRNIAEIANESFDLVVSAGNRADSHRINRNGPEDLAEIDALADRLDSVRIGKLVLVSTVCVYAGGSTPTESTPLSPEDLTPYGANRLHQEQRLSAAHDTLVIRLPQLYGDGLKKGIIYDLANDYRVEHIRPDAEFQYYDARRLWNDIGVALEAGIDSLNLATPPLRADTVAREGFGIDVSQNDPGPADPFAAMYSRDMRTEHAGLFGASGGYLLDEAAELDGIREFARSIREVV